MSAARIPQADAPGWRVHALALIGYLVATLAYFASTLPALGDAFPGGPVATTDGWQNVWHLWWAHRALSLGESPLFTPLLFYPQGVNLAIHPLNLSNGLLFWPVTALAGPVVAYNAALLTAFVLAGWGAYLLARHCGASHSAAFVAGLLFTFSPFHATKAYDGQLEMIALQWVPLYLWLLLRTLEHGEVRTAPLAGLMLAIVGYTSLYYLLYGALLSLLLVLLWLPWRASRRNQASYLAQATVVPVVAVLALAPLLLQLNAALTQVAGATVGGPVALSRELQLRSADLIDFVLPSNLHPIWGPTVSQLGPWLHPGIAAWNDALGYVALGLSLVGWRTQTRRTWRWALVAGVGLLLALGPTLTVAGWATGLPLPYRLLLNVPGMGVTQRPGHFVVLTLVALIPLSALGLTALARRLPRGAPAFALLLAVVELAPPAWQMQRLMVHPALAGLAGGAGAVMSLPINIDSSESLGEQIVHGRPLVGGFLARIPSYPFADLTPGVRQLWHLAPDDATMADPAGATAAEVLAAYGIGDVVVRWERIAPERRTAALAALAQVLPNVAPSYDEDSLAVYHVPPTNATPFVFFGRGWSPEERGGDRRWRWMSASGQLTLLNPGAAPAPVALHLRAESYGRPRVATLRFGGAAAGTWAVSAQPVATTRSLHLLLPPGESHLSVEAPAEADPGGRGPISLSVSAVRLEVAP